VKTPSADLFELIKSLSPQEKKYFKQQSRVYAGERENTYELLFDAIDEQDRYDEAALKKKFKGQAFVNQFSVAKNYLYDKILDALHSQHAEQDDTLNIERMIGRTEILMRRNLMKQALLQYEKTEAKMMEVNALTLLPHLARQKNLILARILKHFDIDTLIENTKEAAHHAEVLLNYLQYETLDLEVSRFFADSKLLEKKEAREALDKLMQHSFFTDEKNTLSFRAKHYFTKANYRYLTVQGKWNEALTVGEKYLSYLEKNERPTREWQVTYKGIFIDILEIGLHEHNRALCDKMVKKFEVLITKDYYNKVSIRQDYFMFMLDYFAEFEIDTKKSLAFYEQHKKWWLEEKHKMDVIVCHRSIFNLLRIHFQAKKWSDCILLLNEQLEMKVLNTAGPRARIMWLMIQYEIRNMELLKNQSKNVMDWFKKHSTLNEAERQIILFFEKLSSARDKRELKEKFIGIRNKLSELKNNIGYASYDYRDFENWLARKIIAL